MTVIDVVSRVAAIQSQIDHLHSAFNPQAAQPASAATSSAAPSTTAGASTSFSTSLATALSPAQAASTGLISPNGGAVLTGGLAPLSANATGMLTTGQQQFAARLAANTGMDSGVVSAWLLAEESGGAATSRQSANNNDWLNIGYTDSGTYGSADSVWSNPITAADATSGWLKGQNTIPGYGTASSGIQAILSTAGQPPASQISALQQSGWASSGYPALASLYQQVA